MKEYPKPKLFKPTPDEERRVAEKLAKHFSSDKILVTKAGEKIQGSKSI